jgi:hypothetical protein
MAEYGHSYASPLTVTDDATFPLGRRLRKSGRKADAKCKFKVGPPKAWNAVEISIRIDMIEKKKSELNWPTGSWKK